MSAGNTPRASRQHKGRNYTARGNDRAHLASALAHYMAEMHRRPFLFIRSDAEQALRIMDELRAALGKSIDEATDGRLERVQDQLQRAIERGAFRENG